MSNMSIFIAIFIAAQFIRVLVLVLGRKRIAKRTRRSGNNLVSNYMGNQSFTNDSFNMHNDFMMQEQNRLFQEQMQRDAQQAIDTHNNAVMQNQMQNQMQRDMDEAARFSMNSSYNAMSDANFVCTGIDSFGHNPF